MEDRFYDQSLFIKGECVLHDPRRILIIQMRQIGDVVVATPVIRVLRQRFPKAHIAFLVEEHCAPVLTLNPHLDEVLVYTREVRNSLSKQLVFLRDIRRMRFDLVLTFLNNLRTAVIALGSRAQDRVAFPSMMNVFYTTVVRKRKGYAALRRQQLLKALGIFSEDLKLEGFYSDDAQEKVREFLDRNKIRDDHLLMTFTVYSKKATHCWPFPNYTHLVRSLAGNGRRFVFLEGPGEHQFIDPIMRETKGLAVKAPPLTLEEVTALIDRADIHVGVCTGTRHIAVSQGTPSLTIIGGSSVSSWTHPSPWHKVIKKDLPCQPCGSDSCPHLQCLVDLSVEEVVSAVEEFITQLNLERAKPLSHPEEPPLGNIDNQSL